MQTAEFPLPFSNSPYSRAMFDEAKVTVREVDMSSEPHES